MALSPSEHAPSVIVGATRAAPKMRRPDAQPTAVSSNDVLDLLATTARARLRLLAGLGLGGFLTLALLAIAVPLIVGTPLRSAGILGGLSIFLALVSGVVWWLAKRTETSSHRAISLGLGYAWLSGQAMAVTEVILAPDGGVYNGVPGLCVWIVLFPMIIPCLPRQALTTGVAIALALPANYLIARLAGMEAVAAEALVGWFVPPLFCAGLAGTASVMVNRLTGQLAEARRAVRELGSYALVHLLGHGGMGEVWLAKHRLLPRSAAVKFLKIPGRPHGDLIFNARFEREARAIALLRSPHTVQLYDFGVSDDGELYFAMELLDGLDLNHLVRRHGRQSEARVATILAQMCLSLMEAHARGLIHRDLSPRNIMLCRLGAEVDHVKVLDFGLVGVAAGGTPDSTTVATGKTTVVGTPGYIAPEVLAGEPATARSDLYAIGCLGYWLLTGTTLHPGPNGEDLDAHCHQRPQPPSVRLDRELHEGLEELILACITRDPAQRPGSAADVRAKLLRLHFADTWDETRARLWWSEHPVSE